MWPDNIIRELGRDNIIQEWKRYVARQCMWEWGRDVARQFYM